MNQHQNLDPQNDAYKTALVTPEEQQEMNDWCDDREEYAPAEKNGDSELLDAGADDDLGAEYGEGYSENW